MPKWHCHDRRLSQPEFDVSTFILPSKTAGVLGSDSSPCSVSWAFVAFVFAESSCWPEVMHSATLLGAPTDVATWASSESLGSVDPLSLG